MRKRIDLYVNPKEQACQDIEKFLQDLEIRLVIRNIETEPLNYNEIVALFRHFDLKHFLNSESKAYKKHKLDQGLPDRKEIFTLMADDNTLIRRPIVVAGRLMVVGCNIDKISEMLQIRPNGSELIVPQVNLRRIEIKTKSRKS